jgi:hypothetical protein
MANSRVELEKKGDIASGDAKECLDMHARAINFEARALHLVRRCLLPALVSLHEQAGMRDWGEAFAQSELVLTLRQ